MRITIGGNKHLEKSTMKMLIGLIQDAIDGESKISFSSTVDFCINEPVKERAKPATRVKNIPYEKIVDFLNQKSKRNFSPNSEATKKLIRARWKDLNNKWSDEQKLSAFHRVIDNKLLDWFGDPKMDMYLRPNTLFGPKFESYLNERDLNELSNDPFDELDEIMGDK